MSDPEGTVQIFDSPESIRKEIERQGLNGSLPLSLKWLIQEHESDIAFVMPIIKDVITNIEGYNPDGFINASIESENVVLNWDFNYPTDVIVIAPPEETAYFKNLKDKMDQIGRMGSIHISPDWFFLDEGTSHLLSSHIHSTAKKQGLSNVDTKLEVDPNTRVVKFSWVMSA